MALEILSKPNKRGILFSEEVLGKSEEAAGLVCNLVYSNEGILCKYKLII